MRFADLLVVWMCWVWTLGVCMALGPWIFPLAFSTVYTSRAEILKQEISFVLPSKAGNTQVIQQVFV